MNWLNLKTSQLREPQFIGSDPVSRATWLCLLAYCVEVENGGRIVGAATWKDRQWQQTCGVTLRELQRASKLISTSGDDIHVWGYPSDKEAEVRQKREAAKTNGKLGGRPRTNEEPTLVSKNNQRPKAEGEGKEKEKGKEGERELFCPESEEPTAGPDEPLLVFPCDGPAKEWELTTAKISEWQATYPLMDVLSALMAARQWCIDNPTRRKTANGMPRYLGNWLSTSQNKGEHRKGTGGPSKNYWTSDHPDALKPQDELLREAFKKNFGNDPKAARIIEKLDAMHNGAPAPL